MKIAVPQPEARSAAGPAPPGPSRGGKFSVSTMFPISELVNIPPLSRYAGIAGAPPRLARRLEPPAAHGAAL